MNRVFPATDVPQDFMLKWLKDQEWEVGYAQRDYDWVVTARKGIFVVWAYGNSLHDACRLVANRVSLANEVN